MNTARWQRARLAYRTAHPLCELCKLRGRTVASTCVDHIIPRNKGGAMWNDRNFQSLCNPCHTAKTAWENGHGLSVRVLDDGTLVEEGWEPPAGMRKGVRE